MDPELHFQSYYCIEYIFYQVIRMADCHHQSVSRNLSLCIFSYIWTFKLFNLK